MNKVLTACAFLLALFAAGCYKPKAVLCENKPVIDDRLDQLVDQLQAKLYDVPLPFSSEKARLVSDPLQLPYTFTLRCPTFMPHQELVSFYHAEMERMGWDELSFVDACDQSIHVFKKPGRTTIVLVEKSEHACDVMLFVESKELAA